MNKVFHRVAFAIWFGLLAPVPAVAQSEGNSQTIDGITIDWGLMPAAVIAHSAAATPAERSMHGGPPAGAYEYHLTVAVLDAHTGKQIADATVAASMYPVGMSGPWKPLQPMHVASTITYGNYFSMNTGSSVPYRVIVGIRAPEVDHPLVFKFTHYHD